MSLKCRSENSLWQQEKTKKDTSARAHAKENGFAKYFWVCWHRYRRSYRFEAPSGSEIEMEDTREKRQIFDSEFGCKNLRLSLYLSHTLPVCNLATVRPSVHCTLYAIYRIFLDAIEINIFYKH